MKIREVLSIFRTVFDLLLLLLILFLVVKSLTGVKIFQINLVRMSLVTTIIGIIGHSPSFLDERLKKKLEE